MPDEYDPSADPGNHVAQVAGIAGRAPQRVGDRNHLDRTGLEVLDDADPTGRFGERAMHEDDGGLLLVPVSALFNGQSVPRALRSTWTAWSIASLAAAVWRSGLSIMKS